MNTQNLNTLQVLQSFSQKMQKPFPSVSLKLVYQVPLWMWSESSEKKLAKQKKTSADKISKRSSIALSEKYHLEEKKQTFWFPVSKKVLLLIKA